MTTWQLSEDISYCELDGRLIFLDIGRDRYFRLSETLERSFLRFMEGADSADTDIDALSQHHLFSLTTADVPSNSIAAQWIAPTQSALERADLRCSMQPSAILSACAAVITMHRRLKTQHLKSILKDLVHHRYACTKRTGVADEPDLQRRIVTAATVFNYIRPYLPIETRCLIDSLAMVRFLAKLGLRAHLVMGVACDPFSAHAWVQHGPWVLNDTVGNVRAHVPIRVI